MANSVKARMKQQRDEINSIKRLITSKNEIEICRELEKKLLGKLMIVNPRKHGIAMHELENFGPNNFSNKLNYFIFQQEMDLLKKSQDNVIKFDDLINKIKSSDDDGINEQYVREGKISYLLSLTKASNGTANDLETVVTRFESVNKNQKILNSMLEMVNDFDLSDPDLEEIEIKLADINNMVSSLKDGNEPYQRMSELLNEWQNELYEVKKNGKDNIGLHSFYDRLDHMIGGFREGQMVVLGARPGVGKTAFILNLLERFALGREPKNINGEQLQKPAYGVFFSLEMSKNELIERFMGMETQISIPAIRTANLTDQDFAILSYQTKHSPTMNQIYVDDTPGRNLRDIYTEVAKISEEVPHLDFVVVDYLQLVTDDSQNRQQVVAKVSRELKIIAKKYHCVVFALAQLNRQVEQRADHRPSLADLRESGQIEQDADIIIMMSEDFDASHDRPEEKDKDEEQEIDPSEHINIDIVKNRSGSRGIDDFIFHKETSTFHEMTDKEVKEYQDSVENNSDSKSVKEKTTDTKEIKNVKVLRDSNANSKIIVEGEE